MLEKITGGEVFGEPPPARQQPQPDHQREGRDDLEVEQCLAAHTPDLLQVAHAGQAHDHRREDDRRDEHLHQAHERIAERLQLHRKLRRKVPQSPADHDPDQHLEVERAAPRPGLGRCRGGGVGRQGRSVSGRIWGAGHRGKRRQRGCGEPACRSSGRPFAAQPPSRWLPHGNACPPGPGVEVHPGYSQTHVAPADLCRGIAGGSPSPCRP